MNEILEVIKKRRSIRKFEDKMIDDSLLKEILYAGSLAPSAHNKQPWEFVVIKNKNIKKEIASFLLEDDLQKGKRTSSSETALVIEKAPVLILVFDTSPEFPLFSALSIGAAIENMLLCATSHELGSLWIGNVVKVESYIQKLLSKNKHLVSAIALGYKGEDPLMPDRKLVDAITEWKE